MISDGARAATADSAWTDLKRRYGEPQRHYHTWGHIEALLRWHDVCRAQMHRPEGIYLAVLFHDAVYDPARSDNEIESAALLQQASLVGFSHNDRALAEQAILATASHQLPDIYDTEMLADIGLFLDMDLSILAARTDVFDRYEQQIRAEYAHVPDDIFRAGRSHILKRFSDRPRLYFSDWGFGMFETRARENIARSLRRLAGDVIH